MRGSHAIVGAVSQNHITVERGGFHAKLKQQYYSEGCEIHLQWSYV